MTHTTTIERERWVNENDVVDVIEVAVEYTAYPAYRGKRDSLCGKRNAGPQLEPDEPAHVEIAFVTNLATGEEVELTNAEQERIVDRIEDELLQ